MTTRLLNSVRQLSLAIGLSVVALACVAFSYYHMVMTGFEFGVGLPEEACVVGDIADPQARTLMKAVFDGDTDAVRQMLEKDPKLANTASGTEKSEMRIGLLEVAVARQDKRMVDLLLGERVSPNFPPQLLPLGLALSANDPWYARRLLRAGAEPNPISEFAPFLLGETARSGDLRAMSILVENGADVTGARTFGRSALVEAVKAEEFRAAEYLIDRGESVWEVEPRSGASLSYACSNSDELFTFTPHRTFFGVVFYAITKANIRAELAARARVRAKLEAKGYPCPAPSKGELAKAILAGQWPPAAAQRLGAPKPSAALIARVGMYWNPDGTRLRISRRGN